MQFDLDLLHVAPAEGLEGQVGDRIALQQLGRFEEARQSLRTLQHAEPHLTVKSYLARHPSGQSKTGQTWAKALRDAGLPN